VKNVLARIALAAVATVATRPVLAVEVAIGRSFIGAQLTSLVACARELPCEADGSLVARAVRPHGAGQRRGRPAGEQFGNINSALRHVVAIDAINQRNAMFAATFRP
jgi:hypothetical protein